MSIQILTKRISLVLCAIVLAVALGGQLEARERDTEPSKSERKQARVEKTDKDENKDRAASPANTRQTDRKAKPSQSEPAPTTNPEAKPPATTTQPTPVHPTATRAGEQIKWQVIAGGGGINGTSTNYRLSGTVGQVAVGMGSSASYNLNQGFWQDFAAGGAPSCCVGETGDVNADGNDNLTDLTLLVNQLFVTFVPIPCTPEGNTNGDAACDLTLTDLTLLVNKLFVTFDPTALCTDFDNAGC